MDNTVLYSKISSLPENMKSEVSYFTDFLSSEIKNGTKEETQIRQRQRYVDHENGL